MLKVDNFLFCFQLETGGLFLGWLCLIANILGCLACIVCFILACIYGCKDLAELQENWTSDDIEGCNVIHGVVIGVFIILIALCAGLAFIGWKCIQGTKNRNHFQVKPMLILLGVSAVLSLLQIFKPSTGTIINAIVDAIVSAYFFVVMYSLYNVFREERERGGANRLQPHYQLAGKV